MNTDPQSSIWQLRRIATGLSVALVLVIAGCRQQPAESPTAERPEIDVSSDGISSISFDDITETSGVNSTYRTGQESQNYSILESLGGGTGAFDYDHDGQPDLMFAGGGKFVGEQIVGFPTRLFRNRNGTSFANVSTESGLVPPRTYTQACSMCDYDCDGFPDALLTGYAGLQLFRNLGDGTFLEVHEQTGLLDETWSSSAAWGDLNNDNWPDLYLTHYVNWSFENHPACPSPWPEHERDVCPPRAFEPLSDVVYFSRGDVTFYDASEEAQLRKDGKGLGVIIADLDHDQDLDIYVANDMVDNFLYKNDGNGHFTEDGLVSGTATDFEGRPNGSMGLAVCDYNGDLTPDLWVTNFEQESFGLYKNDGTRISFTQVAKPALRRSASCLWDSGLSWATSIVMATKTPSFRTATLFITTVFPNSVKFHFCCKTQATGALLQSPRHRETTSRHRILGVGFWPTLIHCFQ